MDSVVHRGFGEQSVVTAFPESPFVVMKFGGTSVATAENWHAIANLVRARVDEGLRPIVVHSALAGISNELQELPEIAIQNGGAEQIASIRQRHEALAEGLGVDATLCDPHFDTLQQLVDGVRLVGEISPRVLARIMATGELAATTLGAAFLAQEGLAVEWRDARNLLRSESLSDQSERAALQKAADVLAMFAEHFDGA